MKKQKIPNARKKSIGYEENTNILSKTVVSQTIN